MSSPENDNKNSVQKVKTSADLKAVTGLLYFCLDCIDPDTDAIFIDSIEGSGRMEDREIVGRSRKATRKNLLAQVSKGKFDNIAIEAGQWPRVPTDLQRKEYFDAHPTD